MCTEIPKPPGWPIIGNALDLLGEGFAKRMCAQYGPIFKVSPGLGQPDRIIVCSAELLNEICDEKRFVKNPTAGGLSQVRNLAGDGLFTALDGEENWGLAHRILMPALGPMAIGDTFEDMLEIASQLILKWARLEEGSKVAPTDDFTRLTLDTLALCTMDTRFNSFYSETPHAFVDAMVTFLQECGYRAFRPAFITDYIYAKRAQKYGEDMDMMRDIARNVLTRRRATPERKKDLVDAMIHEKDPVTGKRLPEDNIVRNMITFLIAGHETTSGLLSFLLYCLVTHPEVLKKAREEVLAVVGNGALTLPMTSRLPYVTAVVRETLRLYPTAPGFSLQMKDNLREDCTTIGERKYKIRKGETLSAPLSLIHRDRAVYGDDAEIFRPERMLDEHFNKLPKNSWKPFGNGARGCIGRAFAMQETMIVAALLLQTFDFELYDPDYKLEIMKTLTVKPKDFYVKAKLRQGLSVSALQRRLLDGHIDKVEEKGEAVSNVVADNMAQDLLICYGSNAGTCQTLAHTLARDAPIHGFRPRIVSMDDAVDLISKAIPVIIVTASYEGEPPDNAIKFVRWIERQTESPFAGLRHAVYGCGNRDWVDTFQRIPTIVDDTLKRCGSTPLVSRGISDAANNNIFNAFDEWADQHLWPALAKLYRMDPTQNEGLDSNVHILQSTRANMLLQDGGHAIVEEAGILTVPGEPKKRHLRLRLPRGMSYEAGDRLAILPVNHDERVKDVMTRFGLAVDARIALPDHPEQSIYTYLKEYVELNQVATQKVFGTIKDSVKDENEKKKLSTVTESMIKEQKLSAFDLLLQCPSASLPFVEYLAMLPPLRPRQYSISSSPLSSPELCTLTYSVVNLPPANGSRNAFHGAGSNYLASLRPNDRLWASVRPASRGFRLPGDSTIPIVMICAGAGLAPFRGFVQERAEKIKRGLSVGPAMLFIGCRHPERDVLYGSELQEWEKTGAINVKYSFSKAPEKSEGCRYVQDRLWKEKDNVIALVKGTGKFFVCGDSKVLEGVARVVVGTYAHEKGVSKAEAQAWFKEARNERFISEVFD